MFGISISDPGLFWGAVAAIGTVIGIVLMIYHNRKNKNKEDAIKQKQTLGNDSIGYQSGGDINVTEKRKQK